MADLQQGGHRLVEHCFAKLGAQCIEIDTFIQTEAEEESLFEGFVASDKSDLGLFVRRRGLEHPERSLFGGVSQIIVEVAGVGEPHGFVVRWQHRVSIEAEADIWLAAPVFEIVA